MKKFTLEIVLSRIESGNLAGMDSNESGSFSFLSSGEFGEWSAISEDGEIINLTCSERLKIIDITGCDDFSEDDAESWGKALSDAMRQGFQLESA